MKLSVLSTRELVLGNSVFVFLRLFQVNIFQDEVLDM